MSNATRLPIAAAAAPALDASQAFAKQERLVGDLRRLDSVLVAFSGGADSAYLVWAAHRALGDGALAITALSASFSRHDREQAEAFIAATGVRHEFIATHELENPLYVANNADRCYHCKDELFDQMDALALARRVAAIAYGINADDTRDFRPGHRAAHEHHVLAPLLDAELHKAEIRFLSQQAGLATWNRPASACLSSRVPYGTEVTPELLEKIDRAEAVLRALEFRQFRVRAHGELARIEIAADELARGFEPDVSRKISEGVKAAGFAFVTVDLEGYRQGSLNSLLKIRST
ncbi:MAG TPA: ATP-dependent sacrificial sulfur transferase LarE [Candidatus Acidoferrales bacterium]|nr:ATP-dependent sacrificial sulfur transferase LarE [Candidatus Acidoferrales bacterium]